MGAWWRRYRGGLTIRRGFHAAPGERARTRREGTGRLVRFARLLYQRYRHLSHEAARFVTVGAVSLGLTIGGTKGAHSGAGFGPLLSNAIANVVATCVSFAGNRQWTFRHSTNKAQSREFFLFFVLNGVGLALQL